ncbi:UNVERIFIED_CONTAM: hypothetical protein Sangu_2417100 [Sesamum angustifolium]|uniref:Uncharacterized protein n=1 Tax=Sesamum angustifolium TaxID=2727405 RepID=A0AAW2KXJ4_9LAMI
MGYPFRRFMRVRKVACSTGRTTSIWSTANSVGTLGTSLLEGETHTRRSPCMHVQARQVVGWEVPTEAVCQRPQPVDQTVVAGQGDMAPASGDLALASGVLGEPRIPDTVG